MSKDQFLQELKKDLKYLDKKTRNEELAKYQNLDNYDIDPAKIANDIYNAYNIPIKNNYTLFASVNIIINKLQSKDKKIVISVIKFFGYLLLLLILIKIPFIFIRDIFGTFFETNFANSNSFAIWNLSFEILYAITTIIIFINLIKKKAQELDNKK